MKKVRIYFVLNALITPALIMLGVMGIYKFFPEILWLPWVVAVAIGFITSAMLWFLIKNEIKK